MDLKKLFETINTLENDFYQRKQALTHQKSNILRSFSETLANIKEKIEHQINKIFEEYEQDLKFLKILTVATKNQLEKHKKENENYIITSEQIDIFLQNLKKELNFYPDMSNIFTNEVLKLKNLGEDLLYEKIKNFSFSFTTSKLLEDFAKVSENENTLNEIEYSDKNVDDMHLKREILTSHYHAEYEGMFNPCGVAVNKIIHHQDNFYVTVGYDGNICIVNILGK